MQYLIGFFGLTLGLLFWVIRVYWAAKALKEMSEDTKHLQKKVAGKLQDTFGTPLTRVSDPSLAAVILMIQLVRAGSPVLAREKERILALMEGPLAIRDSIPVYDRAWQYTAPRVGFSSIADELTPMLREKLDAAGREELLDMLRQVADAYNGASDLQLEAIEGLRSRLARV